MEIRHAKAAAETATFWALWPSWAGAKRQRPVAEPCWSPRCHIVPGGRASTTDPAKLASLAANYSEVHIVKYKRHNQHTHAHIYLYIHKYIIIWIICIYIYICACVCELYCIIWNIVVDNSLIDPKPKLWSTCWMVTPTNCHLWWGRHAVAINILCLSIF